MRIIFLKLTLLFTLVLYLSELKGQYFGVEGTKWSYTSIRPGNPDRIVTLESIGTEEILGITCNIIQKTNSSCETYGHDTNYIYYEDGQVFWYNEEMNNFTVLYDFNAEVGDSWDIHVDECIINVVIDSVSYDSFNGEILKVLYPNQLISGFENSRIIDKIGIEEFMFPHKGAIGCGPLCEGYWIVDPIRCYEDNQFNYQSIELQEDCFTLSTATNLIENFTLTISPTISTSEFKIKVNWDPGIKIDEISILDINGKEYQNHKLINNDYKHLMVPDRGVYFALVKLNNQTTITKKIIVVN